MYIYTIDERVEKWKRLNAYHALFEKKFKSQIFLACRISLKNHVYFISESTDLI